MLYETLQGETGREIIQQNAVWFSKTTTYSIIMMTCLIRLKNPQSECPLQTPGCEFCRYSARHNINHIRFFVVLYRFIPGDMQNIIVHIIPIFIWLLLFIRKFFLTDCLPIKRLC